VAKKASHSRVQLLKKPTTDGRTVPTNEFVGTDKVVCPHLFPTNFFVGIPLSKILIIVETPLSYRRLIVLKKGRAA
jgi:hypothetical protein